MLSWFVQNLATILISAVLLALVTAVLAGMVKSRKKGKSGCCGGCAGCAMNGCCHKENP